MVRGFLAQQAIRAEAAATTPVAAVEGRAPKAAVVSGSAAAYSSRLAVRLRSATGIRSRATVSIYGGTGGTGPQGGGANGTAAGAGLFSLSNVTLAPDAGQTLTISDAIAGAMTGTVQIGGAGTVVLGNISATIIDIIGTSTRLPWAAIDSSLGRSFRSVA
jgi:hypothetical protein